MYVKGADEFENIIRSEAISGRIDELMSSEGFTIGEANYESRLSSLDEIRDRSLRTRFELEKRTAQLTAAKIHTLEETKITKMASDQEKDDDPRRYERTTDAGIAGVVRRETQ